jgi:hypothetical protein
MFTLLNLRKKGWRIGTAVALVSCASAALAGNADLLALIGGQGNAPYAALVKANGSVETLRTLPPTGLTYRVALNARGMGLVGGTNGSNAYAAQVCPDGGVKPVEGLIAPGEIYTVALNNTGRGIVGGGHLDSNVPYAALVSRKGRAIALDVPASGLIYGVAMNDSQEGIIGGKGPRDSAYAAFVSRKRHVRPIANLPRGLNYSVAINNFGEAIMGGSTQSLPNASLVSRRGRVTPIRHLPSTAGTIYNVAINDSGTGLIAGFSAEGPYGAFVAPDGTLTPLKGLPTGTGFLDGAALDSSGFAMVGGESNGAPFAALVSPNGDLTYLTGLPSVGAINSISGIKLDKVRLSSQEMMDGLAASRDDALDLPDRAKPPTAACENDRLAASVVGAPVE